MIRETPEKTVINGVLTANGIVRWECTACGEVIKCFDNEHTILEKFADAHVTEKCVKK